MKLALSILSLLFAMQNATAGGYSPGNPLIEVYGRFDEIIETNKHIFRFRMHQCRTLSDGLEISTKDAMAPQNGVEPRTQIVHVKFSDGLVMEVVPLNLKFIQSLKNGNEYEFMFLGYENNRPTLASRKLVIFEGMTHEGYLNIEWKSSDGKSYEVHGLTQPEPIVYRRDQDCKIAQLLKDNPTYGNVVKGSSVRAPTMGVVR
jgi:hypothetical protein